MPSFGVSIRFVATLVGAVLFAGVVAIGLWTQDYSRRHQDAFNDHARLILRDLAASLEKRLAIGLTLTQLPDIDRLLERARPRLPGLRTLAVLDERGIAQFSTDPVEIGDQMLEAFHLTHGEGHQTSGEDEIYWITLVNDYGAIAGAAVLRLAASATTEGTIAFALSLIMRSALALGLLSLLAAGLGYWLARRVSHGVAPTLAALRQLQQDPLSGQEGGDLGPALSAFAEETLSRHQRLAWAEKEVARLDELA